MLDAVQYVVIMMMDDARALYASMMHFGRMNRRYIQTDILYAIQDSTTSCVDLMFVVLLAVNNCDQNGQSFEEQERQKGKKLQYDLKSLEYMRQVNDSQQRTTPTLRPDF